MPRSRFGSIQRLDSDHYRVFWTDRGKRKSARIRGTREEAEAYLAAQQLSRGGMSDMAWGMYWKAAVSPTFDGLAAKTISGYERVWRAELEPRISHAMVGKTTWRQVEAVLGEIRAPSVQRQAKALWKKMCNLAVRDGLLDRNPVDASIRTRPQNKRAKTLLMADEVAPWLEAIRGQKYEPLFLMEVGGGLRHEEACAMVRENVSELEVMGTRYALLKIERGLVTVGHTAVLKGTKNEHSVREAVIGAPFADRLLELCEGSGPVCPGSAPVRGEYAAENFAAPNIVTQNFRRWCAANDVPYVRPGDMRSVFATLHGEAGTPDSLVSMSMGHADGGSTKTRHYQQRTRKALIVVADSLTDYLLGE